MFIAIRLRDGKRWQYRKRSITPAPGLTIPALTYHDAGLFYINLSPKPKDQGNHAVAPADWALALLGGLFEQFMLGHIANQLGVVLHPHFFQDAGTVGANRFGA
ncbi:hypothetical protein C8R31_102561 [Nitrosospira sp. Nsp2]|nr:hypothetical protein C8R31_102561 [Nitrosospira sp. Nsp2]